MDTIIPSLERAAHAGDTWEPLRIDRRTGTVKPARAKSRLEAARDRGSISDGECAAGERYARHRELASRATVTPSYGQRTAEGTPVSQMARDAVDMPDYFVLHRQSVRSITKPRAEWLDRFLDGEQIEALGGGGKAVVARARCWAKLRMILMDLETHYGMVRTGEP